MTNVVLLDLEHYEPPAGPPYPPRDLPQDWLDPPWPGRRKIANGFALTLAALAIVYGVPALIVHRLM